MVGSAYVLYRAGKLNESDFWSVAVPGVATGGGTLVLAAVTTWLSSTQRARDDYLRAVDIRRRDAERTEAEHNAALREARKVISYWHEHASGQESIVIANASTESIVEVHLIRAIAQSAETTTILWQWHPDALVDEVDRYRAPSWYCPFALPGSTVEFKGRMINSTSDGAFSRTRIGETPMARRVTTHVAWSDASGRHWQRSGPADPVELTQQYQSSARDQAK